MTSLGQFMASTVKHQWTTSVWTYTHTHTDAHTQTPTYIHTSTHAYMQIFKLALELVSTIGSIW